MVNQAAANINNEKGGAASNKTLSLQVEKVVLTEHGIQLIVDQDRYGFSPFVLSWAKKGHRRRGSRRHHLLHPAL